MRRRLRMCLWKQWKRMHTRISELRALSVPEWACFVMANSRCGAWEMSRNTNNALPTSYWESKGLKSFVNLLEPPYADPNVRWCKRTEVRRPLQLD
nr:MULTISPECIES: hypothetical protein [unclassified Paenibacillus]